MRRRPYSNASLEKSEMTSGSPISIDQLVNSSQNPSMNSGMNSGVDLSGRDQKSMPLLGRSHELHLLGALLLEDDCRAVTLIGPTGVGKTCLALEVVRQFDPEAIKVFWLDAEALGEEFLPRLEATLDLCRTSPVNLLVLDHLEDLSPDLASNPQALNSRLESALAGSPGLRLLIVGQRALRLTNEYRFELGPLSLQTVPGLTSDAAQLFMVRAKLVHAQSWLSAADQQTVQHLCEALDGLPLAIEIAAAQIAFLTPEEMLEHLGALLRLPHPSHPSHRANRHATLEQALLRNLVRLGDHEHLALACVARCVRGATLETLQAMLAWSAREVLPVMHSLCEQHLIRRDQWTSNRVRFVAFEIVRLLLSDSDQRPDSDQRLDSDQQPDSAQTKPEPTHDQKHQSQARLKHAEYFADHSFNVLNLRAFLPDQAQALEEFLLDEPDLELARTFWLAQAKRGVPRAARFLIEVSFCFTIYLPRLPEKEHQFNRVLEAALEHIDDAPSRLAAIFLDVAARALYQTAVFARAETLARRAYQTALKTPDAVLINGTRTNLAATLVGLGQEPEAEVLLRESIAALEHYPKTDTHGWALVMLADLLLSGGLLEEPLGLFQRARTVFETCGNRCDISVALRGLASTHSERGEHDLAIALMLEALHIQREVHGPDEFNMLEVFGQLELKAGHWSSAWTYFSEAIIAFCSRNLWNRLVLTMTGVAQLLLRAELPELAARMLGHMTYLRCRFLGELTGYAKTNFEGLQHSLSELLSSPELEALLLEGQGWNDPLWVLEYLRQDPDFQAFCNEADAPSHRPSRVKLSKRQLEVMQLIRAGLSNKRIAQQLGLSESTVKFHISEVFNKFGVRNRVQALRVLEMQT